MENGKISINHLKQIIVVVVKNQQMNFHQALLMNVNHQMMKMIYPEIIFQIIQN